VSDREAMEAAARVVEREFGGCTVLCANVGVQQFGAVEKLTEAEWRWVLDVNVLGTVNTVAAFLPLLRATSGNRRVLLTASSAALVPGVRLAAYIASKHAVMGYGETLRLELAAEGIGVTIFFPAGMTTRHLESSELARPAALGPATIAPDDIEAMMASRKVSVDTHTATPEHATRHLLAELAANERYVVSHGSIGTNSCRAAGNWYGPTTVRSPREHALRFPEPASTTCDRRPMDDTQKLLALEEIRTLMARRVRCLDTKDWDGFADCYTADAVSHSFQQGDGAQAPPTVGARVIADRVAAALGGVTTVHQVHAPEIELTSDETATGIWPLMDILGWEQAGRRQFMRGYGHYRQTYQKVDGRWLIKEHWLTRLKVETGTEDPESPPSPPDISPDATVAES
jgi:NAD(P)-dependent dehydrogenase (short-subunit alcohol dehydrogenase family)